jgi:hypothetical protein
MTENPAIEEGARAALAEVPPLGSMRAVEEAAHYLEERALRAALEASGWLPARAARRLGCPNASSLTRALARHPDLAAEVERRRHPEIYPRLTAEAERGRLRRSGRSGA